jgi:hypothetical protein
MKIQNINKYSTAGISREPNQNWSKDFCIDLSEALMSANIPFEKLSDSYHNL